MVSKSSFTFLRVIWPIQHEDYPLFHNVFDCSETKSTTTVGLNILLKWTGNVVQIWETKLERYCIIVLYLLNSAFW